MESTKLTVHLVPLYCFTRLPRPYVVIPFTAVQERAALFRSHSASSQNLNKSRGISGLHRRHRKFPHWLSLAMDVGLL